MRVVAHTTAPLSGSRIAELVTTGSNPGIRTALGRLVHHGTVLARRYGPSILYTANRDHLSWPTIEHAVHATDTLLGTLQDRIADLARAHLGRLDAGRTTLALFGSVAREARRRAPSAPEGQVVVAGRRLLHISGRAAET